MWREPDKADLAQLSQLNETQIKCLWWLNFWDGPLDGMAEYGSRKVWFDYHHDDVARYYVLYPLIDEQIREAELWHRTEGKEEWNGPTLLNTRPLGWFVAGRNDDFYAIKVYPPGTLPDDTTE